LSASSWYTARSPSEGKPSPGPDVSSNLADSPPRSGVISVATSPLAASKRASCSNNGYLVKFSIHASKNTRPRGAARTFVRTLNGFETLNLKYCGKYFRSPDSS